MSEHVNGSPAPYGTVLPLRTDGPRTARTADGRTGGESVQAVRRILLTRASDIEMKPVRWVWAERIPFGTISVIPGREGIGKSLMLAWLTTQSTHHQ